MLGVPLHPIGSPRSDEEETGHSGNICCARFFAFRKNFFYNIGEKTEVGKRKDIWCENCPPNSGNGGVILKFHLTIPPLFWAIRFNYHFDFFKYGMGNTVFIDGK